MHPATHKWTIESRVNTIIYSYKVSFKIKVFNDKYVF